MQYYAKKTFTIYNTSLSSYIPINRVCILMLQMRTQGRGEVLLSLCWQPTANRLSVVVLKARNLPQMDVTGLADPYVKLYLLYDGQRIAKKKTHIKKRTLNPVFNESFVFDLPPAASQSSTLDKVALQVLVLDWDRVTKNEVRGTVKHRLET